MMLVRSHRNYQRNGLREDEKEKDKKLLPQEPVFFLSFNKRLIRPIGISKGIDDGSIIKGEKERLLAGSHFLFQAVVFLCAGLEDEILVT